MRYQMRREFSAVLKTPDDKILEYGRAQIVPETQGINFRSEFVPLFKMGTPLKIVRVHEGIETQVFCGEVYLSARNLLQLVSVTDEVLPGAASAFLYDVSFPAQITTLLSSGGRWSHFPLLHREKSAMQTIPVTVSGISLTQVRLSGQVLLLEGQPLTLRISELQIERLPVSVDLVLNFGKSTTTKSYRCRILELAGNNLLRLDRYVQQLSLKTNKRFPPVT